MWVYRINVTNKTSKNFVKYMQSCHLASCLIVIILTEQKASYKPFLRWAGGKNWLIKYLPAMVSDLDFNTYYEPFFGGGSVFFNLNPKRAKLSDANFELVETYRAVQEDVEKVLEQLALWQVNEDQYYAVRTMSSSDLFVRAARFIYLNRTSFNGIYRVNRKGEYNVPYGHKDGYQFDEERIRGASRALQGKKVFHSDFAEALRSVEPGDLVFLDPPYTVAHNNNGFIEYNKNLFSLEDQIKLRQCIDELASKGAYFILTNAAHEKILEIFGGCGDKVELSRFSCLGGKQAKREIITEYVFSNIPDWRTREML